MIKLATKIEERASGNALIPFFTLWALCGESAVRQGGDTELRVQYTEKALLTGSGNCYQRFPIEEMCTRGVRADVAKEVISRGLVRDSPITTKTITAPTSFLESIFPRRASLDAKMSISESRGGNV